MHHYTEKFRCSHLFILMNGIILLPTRWLFSCQLSSRQRDVKFVETAGMFQLSCLRQTTIVVSSLYSYLVIYFHHCPLHMHGLQLHKILLNPIFLLNQIFGPKPSSRNVIGRCMSILIYRSQVWKDYQIFLKRVKPYKLTPTKTFPEDGLGPKNWFKRKIGFKRILCCWRPCAAGNGENSERERHCNGVGTFFFYLVV